MIEESVKATRRCAAPDCDNPATVRPVVTLVRPKPLGELEIPLAMLFCIEHSEAASLKTLVKSKWWDNISLQFRLRNQPQPIREKTRLDWVSADDQSVYDA